MRRVPLSIAGLLALNLALAGGITARLVRGSEVEAMLTAAHVREPLAAVNFNQPPPRDFSAIQAQALFHRSRSFYVALAAPPVEQPPPDYRFAGSMSIPDQVPTAILIHNQTNASRKVAKGDSLDSWTVADIGPRKVVVTLGGRNAEITATMGAWPGGLNVVSSPPVQPVASPGVVRVLGSYPPGQSPSSQIVTPAADGARVYRPPTN